MLGHCETTWYNTAVGLRPLLFGSNDISSVLCPKEHCLRQTGDIPDQRKEGCCIGSVLHGYLMQVGPVEAAEPQEMAAQQELLPFLLPESCTVSCRSTHHISGILHSQYILISTTDVFTIAYYVNFHC